MNIHPDYKTKKVMGFIADLIIEYGYTDYSDLTESDKAGLAALLCEASGRTDEFSCITSTSHADQTINLFRKALAGGKEEAQQFLDAIKENAIDYFDYTMNALFNWTIDDYQRSRREWQDHIYKHGDPDQAYQEFHEGLR